MTKPSYYDIGFEAGCVGGPDTPERAGIPDDASIRARNQFYQGHYDGELLRRVQRERLTGNRGGHETL